MTWLTKKLEGVFKLRKYFSRKAIFGFLRLIFILIFIFGGSLLIVKKLTPLEYTIHFKRDCDGTRCQKIKEVDSNRNVNIEKEIEDLSSSLERIDFFARFTFLRFDFQTTNQSQFIFKVTEPLYEKSVDIMMQCNFNGKDYIFSPNSGIIFQQKSSLGNIIKELDTIQGVLMNCNPASQSLSNFAEKPFEVAPNAQIQLLFNEEKYHLKFLSDEWNYPLTVLQIFIMTGILLGAYYEILKFVKTRLKK